MSRMISISDNEMNSQIPLCIVLHLKGILEISLEILIISRLLPKKNFKEPIRPKDEKLGAQHVKC